MNIKYIYTSELKETIRKEIAVFFLFLFGLTVYSTINLKTNSKTIFTENSEIEEQNISEFVLKDYKINFENTFFQKIVYFENYKYLCQIIFYTQSIAIYIKFCNFRI
jgi:hypothetical protein